MIKKIILSCTLFLLFGYQSQAQLTEINNLKTKYVNWLIGENINYSNQYVKRRYDRIKRVNNANLGGTKDLSAYNFANPGPVWDFTDDDQSAVFAGLTQEHLIRFVYIYQIKGTPSNPNSAYHRASLRDTILNIFNYIKAKGVNSNTNFAYTTGGSVEDVITSHYGISLNSSAYATAILLMKNELKAAGEFDHHMGALNKLTYFLGPDYLPGVPTYPSNPGANSDIVRSAFQQRFSYILAQDDANNDKIANMAFFKRYVDNAMMVGNGWNDCIKPDFITYHHRGPYANSYGLDALHQSAIINMMLKGSAYALSATSQANLKGAIMAYSSFSADLTMPLGIAGRFPNNDTYDDLRPAFAYLYLADPIANIDAGREFTRLWNLAALVTTPTSLNIRLQEGNLVSINLVHTLGGMQDMANVLALALTPTNQSTQGQFNFPYGGLSVHKYNGYQVSVKGTSKIIWDYEATATENLYGQYVSAGAMEIMTMGSPKTHAGNGLSLLGYDWAHVAGTTVASTPFSVMASNGSNTQINRQMNRKAFLAQASLGGDGVFAIDYEDYLSAIGNNPKSTALKTNFFFKDKILCLGSNIKGINNTYPIHTTLFQTAFNVGNTNILNGTIISGNTSNTATAGSAWWATDALGNGFVIPQSTYNTGAITLQRASQTSPKQDNSGTATGNFAKAYINHGVAPTAGTYQYAIWLQGNAGTQDLAANFANYFEIIKQDAQAHAAKYVPDSIYAYSIFDPAYEFTNDVVKKVNKPAVVMTQKINSNKNLKISLTNPNVGLLANNENPTWAQISSNDGLLNRVPQVDVVKLVLAGKWAISLPTVGVAATVNGNDTELTFSTINGLTIQTELVKQDVPNPTATISGTSSVCLNSTSPNITFTGAAGTAPYTFTYNINGGTTQEVNTVGTNSSVTVSVSTNAVGVFNYNLAKIKDVNGEQAQSGTATVTVNALPAASISGSTTVTQNSTAPTVVNFTGAGGTAPYTFTYNINGGASKTVTSTGNTATVSVPTTTIGTFAYNLISVADVNCSQPQTGSATVIIHSLPTASISGTSSACLNSTSPNITFTGVNGTSPYTFTYTINGGSNRTVITNSTTATVSVPTNSAGTFIYTLAGVADAYGEQAQSGTATVTVNALPAASISGSTTVTQNSTAPTVVNFTGAGGTAPYTFTYNINGGASKTVTSTGNTATVSVPTTTIGTFAYNLISVADVNCSQPQTGSATVIIHSLPTASISGTSSACLNSTSPNITFTGVNGTSPYTFTYTINGGSNRTVITNSTTATISVPTNSAGKFIYTLAGVADAYGEQAQSGTATVTVNALPAAGISGSTTVTQNSTAPTVVTFTGAGGTAPYTFTYNINGGASKTVTSTGNTATVSLPTTTIGTFAYNLISVADVNCSQPQTGSATVIIRSLPTANISGSTSVCNFGTSPNITFTGVNGTSPYTFTYTINGGNNRTVTTNSTTATISVPTNSAGTFIYTLAGVADAYGEQAQSGTATVTVNALLVVSISSNKGLSISKGDAIILTATGGTQYSWSGANVLSGQNTPALTIRPKQSGTYRVTVTNASGCVSDQTIAITVIEDYKLEASTVVTPNGDGYNDKFIVKNIDYYPNNTLKIFDKAGRILYTKHTYANDWDGTINGSPLSEGTYYYIIDLGNGIGTFKGYINIIRN